LHRGSLRQQLALPLYRVWWPLMGAEVSLAAAVIQVTGVWEQAAQNGEMSAQSAAKFAALLERFARYAAAQGVTMLDQADGALVTAFIQARGRSRRGEVATAAVATRRLRRSVLRAFFRVGRHLLLTGADPTLDLVLPERPDRRFRPLDGDEAGLCRHFAQLTEDATRHAAVLALALAGIHSGEIGNLALGHLDAPGSRVWTDGSTRTQPRWCLLDPWGVRALERRAEQVQARRPHTDDPDTLPLLGIGGGSAAQRQARVCVPLREVLDRAGLGDDPTLRPSSITAHAGWLAFQASGRIEDAARMLGMRSLDRAAELVGYDWQAGAPAPAG
jgi:integrase/recombinase XerC